MGSKREKVIFELFDFPLFGDISKHNNCSDSISVDHDWSNSCLYWKTAPVFTHIVVGGCTFLRTVIQRGSPEWSMCFKWTLHCGLPPPSYVPNDNRLVPSSIQKIYFPS